MRPSNRPTGKRAQPDNVNTAPARALNYTPAAIETIGELASGLAVAGLLRSALNLQWLIERIHAAPKFVLPDYGMLFDLDMPRAPLAESARLPFPEIVTEYTVPEVRYERVAFETQTAPKRIAYASADLAALRRLNPLIPADLINRAHDRGGFFVVPIWCDESDCWLVSHTLTINCFTLESEREESAARWRREEASNPDLRAAVKGRAADAHKHKNDHIFYSVPAPFLPEIMDAEIELHGRKEAVARAWLDTHDETASVLDLALAHDCVAYARQVRTIPASRAANIVRAKLGHGPLYDYTAIPFIDSVVEDQTS